jgi:hypothetical protein
MNSNGILTRVEIFLYSTLTSSMSGINHLRGNFNIVGQSKHSMDPDPSNAQTSTQTGQNSIALYRELIKVVLPALFLWIILGFAAGFLIGLLQPR